MTVNCQQQNGVNLGSWDEAIRDAKAQIARIKTSIKFFQLKKDEGQEWPGKQFSTQSEGEQHSV